jgi:hypothetical protein
MAINKNYLDYNKIINIKNKKQLLLFNLDKPIFKNNYLFHYLILFNNIKAIKLYYFPIYKMNSDGLNGFHLAAKNNYIDLLCYLIDNYSDYIYNLSVNGNAFTFYLDYIYINILLKKYNNLKWNNLLIYGSRKYNILSNILLNYKYNELKKFIKLYKFNITNDLFSIVNNINIKNNKIIKILSKIDLKYLNIKNKNNEGLIIEIIKNNKYKLFKYLINREIDIDYFSIISNESPIIISIKIDIINNKEYYSKIIINNLITTNKYFYKNYDKYINNLLHITLYYRIENNKSQMININYNIDFNILKLGDTYSWNQMNIFKITPLELLLELDYEIYSKILIDNNIEIYNNTINNINNKKIINQAWYNLFNKMNIINLEKEKDDINFINYKYKHYNIFNSREIDELLYYLYIIKKYNNIHLPYLNLNLKLNNNIEYNNDIFKKIDNNPWNILFSNENKYYIHPYLNNIINNYINIKNKRFVFVTITIYNDNSSHANILIYDLLKMTVERFEPYGNDFDFYNIDMILEEELTWNTNLTYISPKEYLPYAGFQTISDENNIYNFKSNDLQGYCLAWCLWYIEIRLINPDINQKKLVDKLINKLNNLNISYKDYIRNYSFKITKLIYKDLKKKKIINNLSNIVHSVDYYNKILEYYNKEISKIELNK